MLANTLKAYLSFVQFQIMEIKEPRALPLLIKMLKRKDTGEQHAAAWCLWNLAFEEKYLKDIKQEPGCVETLTQLASSASNVRVKKTASGVLWMLQNNAPDSAVAKKLLSKEEMVLDGVAHDIDVTGDKS